MAKQILVQIACFKCGSMEIYRDGFRNGRQKYKCGRCRSCFEWPPKVQRLKAEKVLCPDCGSSSLYRQGWKRGIHCYQCLDCGRHFQASYPKTLSPEKRKMISELMGKGMKNKDIAEVFGVNPSSVSKIRRKMKDRR